MRLAIISVTSQGAKLGRKLADLLSGVGLETAVYAKCGKGQGHDTEYEELKGLIAEVFKRYDGLIFIMATGIVVRTLAPFIEDKRTDPACVVMDEQGKFAISLLSGHLGGANYLANLIAEQLSSLPVITTASDVQGKTAPDALAGELGLTVEPFSHLKRINTLLVEGQTVTYFIDEGLSEAEAYHAWLNKRGVLAKPLIDFSPDSGASVLITDKQLEINGLQIHLRPKTLVAGIGCRRDTEAAKILDVLKHACLIIGRSSLAVGLVASASVKADEVGLLEAAAKLGAKTRFFTPEVLADIVKKAGLSESLFVKEKIGVGSVCEAAAICGANNKLLLNKTIYPGITIALAEVKSGLSGWDRELP